jgi:hypothetical protein
MMWVMGSYRADRAASAGARASLVAGLFLFSLGAACTGPQSERAVPSPVAGRSPAPEVSASPLRVSDQASFVDALSAAGFDVRLGQRTGGDHLFRPGREVLIDGVTVWTYEYPSERALAKVRAFTSRHGDMILTPSGGTAIVEWAGMPHFFGTGALLVLYLGERRHTLDALELVLGRQFAGGTIG